MNPRLMVVLLAVGLSPLLAEDAGKAPVRVGTKAFTENNILGHMVRQLSLETGRASQVRDLGGTQIVWKALLAGEIDVYPEYTGTITNEILAKTRPNTIEEMRAQLDERGIVISRPIGFANNYVLGMRKAMADTLGIRTITDLKKHPTLRLGFSSEFCEREDGWPALRVYYSLPHENVRGMEHDLAYRALADEQIDVTDFYSTDAKLTRYPFVIIEDDAKFFPDYSAVLLYRKELESSDPDWVSAIKRLEGSITAEEMADMNAAAELESIRPSQVAARFLLERFGISPRVEKESFWSILAINTYRHLQLVLTSLSMGILVAIPLGIIAAKLPRVGQVILAAVGLFQTIPSIVLLVLLIRPLGVGERPAIFALFVYSLLPIVRNTHAGIRDIPASLIESAQAVGLGDASRLRRIELPLASRSILAGIKTAAVINVGTATLGGFIGAGGYGQPIFQGLRSDNWTFMVWHGAIPTAVLSLIVLAFFEGIEWVSVPRGLRLRPREA